MEKTPVTSKILKGYSEILLSKVHFSQHMMILLHILKEPSYSNLTSIGLLQKQNSFYEIRSIFAFLNFWCPGISTVFNGEVWFMIYTVHFTNVNSLPSEIWNIVLFSECLLMSVTEIWCLSHPEISEYSCTRMYGS